MSARLATEQESQYLTALFLVVELPFGGISDNNKKGFLSAISHLSDVIQQHQTESQVRLAFVGLCEGFASYLEPWQDVGADTVANCCRQLFDRGSSFQLRDNVSISKDQLACDGFIHESFENFAADPRSSMMRSRVKILWFDLRKSVGIKKVTKAKEFLINGMIAASKSQSILERLSCTFIRTANESFTIAEATLLAAGGVQTQCFSKVEEIFTQLQSMTGVWLGKLFFSLQSDGSELLGLDGLQISFLNSPSTRLARSELSQLCEGLNQAHELVITRIVTLSQLASYGFLLAPGRFQVTCFDDQLYPKTAQFLQALELAATRGDALAMTVVPSWPRKSRRQHRQETSLFLLYAQDSKVWIQPRVDSATLKRLHNQVANHTAARRAEPLHITVDQQRAIAQLLDGHCSSAPGCTPSRTGSRDRRMRTRGRPSSALKRQRVPPSASKCPMGARAGASPAQDGDGSPEVSQGGAEQLLLQRLTSSRKWAKNEPKSAGSQNTGSALGIARPARKARERDQPAGYMARSAKAARDSKTRTTSSARVLSQLVQRIESDAEGLARPQQGSTKRFSWRELKRRQEELKYTHHNSPVNALPGVDYYKSTRLQNVTDMGMADLLSAPASPRKPAVVRELRGRLGEVVAKATPVENRNDTERYQSGTFLDQVLNLSDQSSAEMKNCSHYPEESAPLCNKQEMETRKRHSLPVRRNFEKLNVMCDDDAGYEQDSMNHSTPLLKPALRGGRTIPTPSPTVVQAGNSPVFQDGISNSSTSPTIVPPALPPALANPQAMMPNSSSLSSDQTFSSPTTTIGSASFGSEPSRSQRHTPLSGVRHRQANSLTKPGRGGLGIRAKMTLTSPVSADDGGHLNTQLHRIWGSSGKRIRGDFHRKLPDEDSFGENESDDEGGFVTRKVPKIQHFHHRGHAHRNNTRSIVQGRRRESQLELPGNHSSKGSAMQLLEEMVRNQLSQTLPKHVKSNEERMMSLVRSSANMVRAFYEFSPGGLESYLKQNGVQEKIRNTCNFVVKESIPMSEMLGTMSDDGTSVGTITPPRIQRGI